MLWRSALAVLGGWMLVGLLVVCTDMVIGKAFPNDYVNGKLPPDNLAALSLATSILWSVLGGWFCARFSPNSPRKHILGLILWGLLMGIVSAITTWGKIQAWYQIGLIVAWIPAVFLGGWLHWRKGPSKVMAASA